MGRDDKKGTSNNTRSLPQTPKNQKIKPDNIKEEVAKEFLSLEKKEFQKKKKRS